MKINEVCNATSLTKKAIEYYERRHLINPKRLDSGYRIFSNEDVEKLKDIKLYRDLGFGVQDIKEIINSRFPTEELKKKALKREMEFELKEKKLELIKGLITGENRDVIIEEVENIKSKYSIKTLLLDAFPDFYGRFILIHFQNFLEDKISTEKQNIALKTIIEFLDNIEPPKIPYELMIELEEGMEFWNNDRLIEFQKDKVENISNIDGFIEDNKEAIEKYLEFKNSDEYKDSVMGKLMKILRDFQESSGYSSIFIPAMRDLSPSYNAYYENLLKADKKIEEAFNIKNKK